MDSLFSSAGSKAAAEIRDSTVESIQIIGRDFGTSVKTFSKNYYRSVDIFSDRMVLASPQLGCNIGYDTVKMILDNRLIQLLLAILCCYFSDKTLTLFYQLTTYLTTTIAVLLLRTVDYGIYFLFLRAILY
ncbi:unnamed protein product [Adineta ricciae]|uniref:Uncharacterized protein n=1 Tax=Adineta ricciae TaxID=249248 RepID=A0A815PZ13_ADIRI|nr:unnamed protein product [Adineta ricciae]CAF1456366.1 unnamed protein product [Adineta ricciae]